MRHDATRHRVAAGDKMLAARATDAHRVLVLVLVREDDVLAALGESSVDVVVGNVAGPSFGAMLCVLRRVSSGTIGRLLVTPHMRTLTE